MICVLPVLFSPKFCCQLTKDDCLNQLNSSWVDKKDLNFDNIGNAISTLFEMSTTEGWVDVMHSGVDATGIETHPVREYRRYHAVFFVLWIFVGSLIAMNLFVGAVIDAFNAYKRDSESTDLYLSPTQQEWVQNQLMVNRAKLQPRKRKPKDRLREMCFMIAETKSFEMFVMCCIFCNTLTLAMKTHNDEKRIPEVVHAIEIANLVFAVIFTLEAVIKLLAWGKKYFRDSWNIFDLCVVVGCNVSIALKMAFAVDLGPVATLARAFRMLLIFRVMQAASGMQNLIATVLTNLVPLGNIASVLALVIFVFAIMGMQLFATVATGAPQEELNDQVNFQSFGNAFLILFRASTGEAWNSVMYELMLEHDSSNGFSLPLANGTCVELNGMTARTRYAAIKAGQQAIYEYVNGSRVNPALVPANPFRMVGCGQTKILTLLFWYSFVVVATFIMLNLFVAVILEGFEERKDEEERCLKNEHFDNFKRAWLNFDEDATYKIKADQLIPMFLSLDPPLGINPSMKSQKHEVRRVLMELDVPIDGKGEMHFKDVCVRLAKRVYKNNCTRKGLSHEILDAADVNKMRQFARTWAKTTSHTELHTGYLWQHEISAKVMQRFLALRRARKEGKLDMERRKQEARARWLAAVEAKKCQKKLTDYFPKKRGKFETGNAAGLNVEKEMQVNKKKTQTGAETDAPSIQMRVGTGDGEQI